MSGVWFYSPPCLWFSSPRYVALRYKINDFLPHKAIKQYVIGLNSVKMYCTNQILPFGTTKSVKSTKICFFHLLIFFPIFWFYTQLYTGLPLTCPSEIESPNWSFNKLTTKGSQYLQSLVQASTSHLMTRLLVSRSVWRLVHRLIRWSIALSIRSVRRSVIFVGCRRNLQHSPCPTQTILGFLL